MSRQNIGVDYARSIRADEVTKKLHDACGVSVSIFRQEQITNDDDDRDGIREYFADFDGIKFYFRKFEDAVHAIEIATAIEVCRKGMAVLPRDRKADGDSAINKKYDSESDPGCRHTARHDGPCAEFGNKVHVHASQDEHMINLDATFTNATVEEIAKAVSDKLAADLAGALKKAPMEFR